MTNPEEDSAYQSRLEEYVSWAKENFKSTPFWCAVHWAPAAVKGRNGARAAVMLMDRALLMAPIDIVGDATALNKWIESRKEPICCTLGDEEMRLIWVEC